MSIHCSLHCSFIPSPSKTVTSSKKKIKQILFHLIHLRGVHFYTHTQKRHNRTALSIPVINLPWCHLWRRHYSISFPAKRAAKKNSRNEFKQAQDWGTRNRDACLKLVFEFRTRMFRLHYLIGCIECFSFENDKNNAFTTRSIFKLTLIFVFFFW